MNRRNLSQSWNLAALALSGVLVSVGAQAQEPGCQAVTAETCAVAKSLKRGINFGNMLEAPREGDWGPRVEPAYIDLAAGAFTTVRLPVRWTNHAAATEDATLDETFAKRVDGIVDALLGKGVNVILNVHHYNQITGDGLGYQEFPVNPAVVEPRLVNIWRQLGERYKNRSSKLVFELLNEPHGKLDGEPWNVLAPKLLAAVRASNPSRAVLIGPSDYNSVRGLNTFRMPADRNLILSIHNYEPFGFTHQGASWIPLHIRQVGSTCCDATQKQQINNAMDTIKRWSVANGYPVHLGEFGTHSAAPMEGREAYARAARDAIEARGFSWTYWDLVGTFSVYDPATRKWVEPIRRALLD